MPNSKPDFSGFHELSRYVSSRFQHKPGEGLPLLSPACGKKEADSRAKEGSAGKKVARLPTFAEKFALHRTATGRSIPLPLRKPSALRKDFLKRNYIKGTIL